MVRIMNEINNDRGFTLVEILITLSIIGVLTAIAVPSIMTISNKMKTKGLDSKIEAIEQAAVVYAQENSNKIKNNILKQHPTFSSCNSNQQNSDGSFWCLCDQDSKDVDGTPIANDCKFVLTITLKDLIESGHYKSETPTDPNTCDVGDPTNSNNCLDCVPITIKLDDNYKSATAAFDKDKLNSDKDSCTTIDKFFTITLDANGGYFEDNTVTSKTTIATYGKAYPSLERPNVSSSAKWCPENKVYRFMGWYTAASGGTVVNSNMIYTILGDQTLYAHYACISQITIPTDPTDPTENEDT